MKTTHIKPLKTIRKRNKKIKDLYQNGLSSYEIQERYNFGISTRQIQRIIKESGVVRSKSEAFQLAVNKGRVTYHRKPEEFKKKRVTLPTQIRFKILQRDNFKCQLCGATKEDDRLQVDHKDGDGLNNDLDNLWVLCESCNKGKLHLNNECNIRQKQT